MMDGLGVLELDHTAIAVRSIDEAVVLYRDLLGGEPVEYVERPNAVFRTLLLRYPNGAGIELISPVGDTGFVHEFIQRRGEGVHHITFVVADIERAVAVARAARLRVVGEDFSDPTWQEAFISPRSAHGTIVQIAQTTLDVAARTAHWPPDAYRVERRGR
jgi:methylmalonyl-CoA/ethylmalonyl-CoA epimerase